MVAYYNEFDPFAASWLERLIDARHIAYGVVDRRSIEDVTPEDLKGFTQCHFFAGVGVWSLALRGAGWADDRPVWTGSCPCQPFSSAGKGNGFADERHLWPAFHWLVEQRGPPVVFGEQVASKDGLAWLALVSSDLEATGYAFGAADLCAAGFGAPHIRQRSFWAADAPREGGRGRLEMENGRYPQPRGPNPLQSSRLDRTVPASGFWVADSELQQRPISAPSCDDAGGRVEEPAKAARLCCDSGTVPTSGFWRDADWLGCRDGKWRPVEPGTFPLAHGSPNHVGRLRGYGNAIVAPVAQAFIEAYMESVG